MLHRIVICIFLISVSGCANFSSVKYDDLSFEEKVLYDNALDKAKKQGSGGEFAIGIAKETVQAQRSAQWAYGVAPKVPASFKKTSGNGITHINSQTEFPLQIGNFLRKERDLVQYDKSGNNVSVGYNLYGASYSITLTQYIYPNVTKEDVKKHMEGIKTAIKIRHNDAKLIEEKKINNNKYYVSYKYMLNKEWMNTYAYLFIAKDRFVKLRITLPANKQKEGDLEIKKYLEKLPLPLES